MNWKKVKSNPQPRSWWVYAINPVDHGWEDLTAASIDNDVPDCAKQAAEDLGWEGDVRGDECARFFVPAVDSSGFAECFVWKQDNNGTTFVAASCALPHLEER